MIAPRHDPKSNGFTLVELLVVIVIIASLAALSIQGFQIARMHANQAVSTGNLRQLAAANLMYAADYQTYCPASDVANKIRWHGARTNTKEKFDPEKGYLSEYLGLSHSVGICPEFQRHLSGSTSFENGSGGYGYNEIYIGGLPENNFKPNRPANVSNPARTIMFATTAFAKSDGLQEYPFAEPPQSVDVDWEPAGPLQPSVNFRFNGRALIAWCDGHVSEELPHGEAKTNYYGGSNSAFKIGFCGPADNNGWWNPRN
jgi:prepilin-type N-terminal cleavage/methylation domain-containing protein/prepilin-type processing-associated H-X9-DG protein